MSKKGYFWLLALLCVLSLLLFLGETHFHTRGEPREAVVALSMLNQGNWILPTNNGVEIAFKPPFFHWCIAARENLCFAKPARDTDFWTGNGVSLQEKQLNERKHVRD